LLTMPRGSARIPESTTDCDVLIIGSGAGGSAVALELATAGHDVTVLEEGPRIGPKEISAATPADNLRMLYRHGGLVPIFGRPTIAYGEGRCVGGTTEINGGIFWEPTEELLDRWATEYGIGSYRMSNLAGHVAKIVHRLGVTEQAAGAGNRDSALLSSGAETLGWQWGRPQRAARGCTHLNRCTTGCPTGAKQSMSIAYLPEAESYGARILPNTRVLRLEHDRGTVTGVVAVNSLGARTRFRPRAVFVAAGPFGSAALLRRSGIHRGRAGRNIAFHVNLRTVARFDDIVDAGHGTIFTAQIHEFASRGMLIMPSNVTPGGLAAATAGHGPDTVQRLVDGFDHLVVYTTQVQMTGRAHLAHAPLTGEVMWHTLKASDFAAIRDAFRETARLLLAAGAVELIPPVDLAGSLRTESDVDDFCAKVRPGDWELVSVHAMSSCRMAVPQRGGVCDELGRPYGYRNLRVCDASVLPGATTVSPQGSIMAFAHEIAARYHVACGS